MHGLIFELKTSSGTAVSSTNTALGVWGAVTVYNPSEPTFTNKQECENYLGAQSCVPFQSMMHGVECKPRANVLD
jgi:hypothetical protein